MTIREFIKKNRPAIDAAIRRAVGDPERRLNDEERRLWVLNDEGLYLGARRQTWTGVEPSWQVDLSPGMEASPS